MKKYSSLIIYLLLFSLTNVNGQLSDRIHEQLTFKYLTIDQGLSDNRIRGLGQDKYGFIWIGTRQGMDRFDGYNIKQYRIYYNDSTSFDFKETRGVFSDSRGTLWVMGTYGICYFDWAKDKFIQFSHKNLKNEIVNSGGMAEDQNGNLWFATDQGLLKYNPTKDDLFLFVQENNNPKAPAKGTLDKIVISDKNHVWFSFVRDGIGYYDQETLLFTHFRSTEDPFSLAENLVERLYKDKQGNIWIGHNNKGISKFSYSSGKFKRYYPDPGFNEAGRIRGIIEDARGNFWFGSQGGLYLFNRQLETFKRYAYADHPISTLSHNSIQTMMIDKQEGLWLGTFAGGVSYTNLNASGIVKYEYSKIPSEFYLNDKNVYSLRFDKADNIWAGTENGGLNYLDIKSGKFTYFTLDPDNINTPRSNNIKDIYIDEEGLVWFGTYKGGLSYYNPQISKFTHYIKSATFPQGIDEETIFVIYPDIIDKNWLWIGSTNKLFLFKKKEKEFLQILPETPGFINVPSIRRIYSVCHYMENRIIFGANMILILDRNNNTFTSISQVNDISISSVDFMMVDKYGYLWAAINSDFIVRYDLENNKFKVYDESKGMPNITYLEGEDDTEGNLWLSTNQGIWKMENVINSPDSFRLSNYDNSDNVQSLEFLYHSKAKSPSGEILFGGINGFNSFRPKEVKPNPFVPNVIVTKLSVAGKEVHVGEKVMGRVLLREPIMETKKIHFHHKIKVFTFHFTGFHFVAPENNQFKYKLEGYDEDWLYTDANVRSATYSNLPRGTYTFYADATNNNGKWSEKPFMIEIKVTPPFWKTIWFFLIIAAIITLIILQFIKLREQQLKHDKEILEEKLRKGQQEIDASKIEVSKQSEELRKRDIAEREQKWHNEGMIRLGDVIVKHKNDLQELSKYYLSNLISYLEAQQGAIFILNDDDDEHIFLESLSGYGLNKKKLKQTTVEPGEGLIGVCFKDKETIIVSDIPKGYTEIESGIGSTPPENLILIPLTIDENVMGVIEIASIHKLEDFKIRFIEKISEMFTSNLFTSKTNRKMELLLQQSKQQTEEMKAQEEEMRQNLEEMMATQEEANRREIELVEITKKMEANEKNFQKAIKEKEKALAKAHEIIHRQESEIKKIKETNRKR